MQYQDIRDAIPNTVNINTESCTVNGEKYTVRTRQSRALLVKRGEKMDVGFYMEKDVYPHNEGKEMLERHPFWIIQGEHIPAHDGDLWSGDHSSRNLPGELESYVDTEEFLKQMDDLCDKNDEILRKREEEKRKERGL
jgi:hypothetical protein